MRLGNEDEKENFFIRCREVGDVGDVGDVRRRKRYKVLVTLDGFHFATHQT